MFHGRGGGTRLLAVHFQTDIASPRTQYYHMFFHAEMYYITRYEIDPEVIKSPNDNRHKINEVYILC
jgi:hypothetical protein